MKKNYDFSKAVSNPSFKRIIVSVKIENALDGSKGLRCNALVDTQVSQMILPSAWKDRLGRLESTRTIELETATQEIVTGEVCGPVRIQIEGFPAIYNRTQKGQDAVSNRIRSQPWRNRELTNLRKKRSNECLYRSS